MSYTLDPEMFRIKVGQYSDRWYIDPLPSCDLAEADPEWKAPSVSTIKKASTKDWTAVTLKRLAYWMHQAKPQLNDLMPDEIEARLIAAKSESLDLAAERGTQIHKMFEVYADGGDISSVELGAEAMRYARTVRRILRDHQPKIVLSEFVVISRDIGYGGTGDAIWEIDGALYLVDYKSRSNKNAKYLEEAWQLSAYGHGDYLIVAGEDGPKRIPVPELAGGLVISITPSSYRFYPVDLAAAAPGFIALRDLAGWKAQGTRAVFGKEWENPKPTRDHWVRDRIEVLKEMDGIAPLLERWPESVTKPKHKTEPYSDAEIDLLLPAIEWAEKIVTAPWCDPDPKPPEGPEQPELTPEPEPEGPTFKPDEGDLMPTALVAIEHRYAQLNDAQREWIRSIVEEARVAGWPIRVAEEPTARRVFIARALILAVERRLEPSAFQAVLQTVYEDVTQEQLEQLPLGHWVGLLSWEQASTFAALVKMVNPIGPQAAPGKAKAKSKAEPTSAPEAETTTSKTRNSKTRTRKTETA